MRPKLEMEKETKMLLTRMVELLEKIKQNTENLSTLAMEIESLKTELTELRTRFD